MSHIIPLPTDIQSLADRLKPQEENHARRLEQVTISEGGLTIRDGGNLIIENGGNLSLADGNIKISGFQFPPEVFKNHFTASFARQTGNSWGTTTTLTIKKPDWASHGCGIINAWARATATFDSTRKQTEFRAHLKIDNTTRSLGLAKTFWLQKTRTTQEQEINVQEPILTENDLTAQLILDKNGSDTNLPTSYLETIIFWIR